MRSPDVAINIIVHADVPCLAVVFGGLGVFAYTVWLLHAARRPRFEIFRG